MISSEIFLVTSTVKLIKIDILLRDIPVTASKLCYLRLITQYVL